MEGNEKRKVTYTKDEGQDLWHVNERFVWTMDKTAHALGSAAIALFVFGICGCRPFGVLLGVIVAILLGFIKECIDKYIRKTMWDWGDIVADIIGAFAGGLLSLLAYIIN